MSAYPVALPNDHSRYRPINLDRDPSGATIEIPTNFNGKNYSSLDPEILRAQLCIPAGGRVLDLHGEATPLPFAQNHHEFGMRSTSRPEDILTKYKDSEFDVAIVRGVLETCSDPTALCHELSRVAVRGLVECESEMSALLGASPEQRWIVTRPQTTPDDTATLLFTPRPFVRVPLKHALVGAYYSDPEFRRRWDVDYRNVSRIQIEWNGNISARMTPGNEVYSPANSAQFAEACLDYAICALRIGGVPGEVIHKYSTLALEANSRSATAHNTHGCALWLLNRFAEARAHFKTASQLEPSKIDFARNAALPQQHGVWPSLVLMPPTPDEQYDIASNFGGKVFYAFVGYDRRLAQDLEIHLKDRVVDIGGGQRPLERADVSVDFDILDGVHRQGNTIRRDRPLICADAQQLPFRNHAFDVACCRMVLEHVEHPERACAELQRIARKGFLETPNLLWETVYGHPTHRWLVTWQDESRTLVFKRRTFVVSPFRSAIVYLLYRYEFIRRAFEVTFRNLTTTQVAWSEDLPFSVRVDDDPTCDYDYLASERDAVTGGLEYATDMLRYGLPTVAAAELMAAERCAHTDEEVEAVLLLKQQIVVAARAAGMPDPFPAPTTPAEIKETNAGCIGPTPVVWQAPLYDPSGYADEARNFLYALHEMGQRPNVRELRWSTESAGLTLQRRDLLRSLQQQPVRPGYVHICHMLGRLFQPDSNARINVGRTMFETDRLPAGWAESCNKMDAVWVPSQFNYDTFTAAGVSPNKLRVVPGTIDLNMFSPCGDKMQIVGARGFNFLAVFDWSLRKGWDILLQAYLESFTASDDVALVLQVHSSSGKTGTDLLNEAAAFITNTLQRDTANIPDIVLQDASVPDAFMPALYRTADCYVLPTHGEGWGRPFFEAMACGTPVIATNWSGVTAFITDETSFPLDYEIVPVGEQAARETPTFAGHKWAQPSVSHLKLLMQQSFYDREAAKLKGLAGRTHLEEHFSPQQIAELITTEIARLV